MLEVGTEKNTVTRVQTEPSFGFLGILLEEGMVDICMSRYIDMKGLSGLSHLLRS